MLSPNSFWRRYLTLVVALVVALIPASAWAATATSSARIPADKASAAAAIAKGQLGGRYVFGGESPSIGFDSSGLAYWAYGSQGVTLPRRVADQYAAGVAVAREDLSAGDLVFFDDDGDSKPNKTAVYLGSGTFVISVDPGGVVERSFDWTWYSAHYVGGRRVLTAAEQADPAPSATNPATNPAPSATNPATNPAPSPTNPATAPAAVAARAQLGARYNFGGESPAAGFDSSGLAYWAYGQQGVELPRLVRQQYTAGAAVSQSSLLPGDLVFFDDDGDRTPDKAGIYQGSGEFVISVNPGGVVLRTFSWTWYQAHFVGARRITGAAATEPPVASPAEPPAAPAPTVGEELVAKAKTYIGAPYVFGAEGPTAYDCSGYTQTVMAQLDVRLPRTSLQQSRVGRPVAVKDLRPGDLLFYEDTYKPGVSHVSIYIGNGQMIHAWPRVGVTIADMNRPYFTSHFWGARRVLP